jgi:hypothetical protein
MSQALFASQQKWDKAGIAALGMYKHWLLALGK